MAGEDGTCDTGGDAEVTTSPGVRGDLFSPLCPTRSLLDRLGTKWTSMVIKTLSDGGELRFSELRRRVSGVSQKMLSSTLQSLVRDGLVTRRVEGTVPPRVHYQLTELGHSLEIPLRALREWAEKNVPSIEAHRVGTNRTDGDSRTVAS